MYTIGKEAQFMRDVKACVKRHWEMDALMETIVAIAQSDEVPPARRYRVHPLAGGRKGEWAAHVPSRRLPPTDTWVIIYRVSGERVVFIRAGTHDIY